VCSSGLIRQACSPELIRQACYNYPYLKLGEAEMADSGKKDKGRKQQKKKPQHTLKEKRKLKIEKKKTTSSIGS
jgi:hypothetical protein